MSRTDHNRIINFGTDGITKLTIKHFAHPLVAEINDFLGVCVKIRGTTADVQAAIEAGVDVDLLDAPVRQEATPGRAVEAAETVAGDQVRPHDPAGLLGLLVASLLSAYVSTMSTHLNWGCSYLVHDFYRRFIIRPGCSGGSGR